MELKRFGFVCELLCSECDCLCIINCEYDVVNYDEYAIVILWMLVCCVCVCVEVVG